MSSNRHPNPFIRPLNIALGGALAGVMAYVGVTATTGSLGQSTTGTGTTTSTTTSSTTSTTAGASSVTSGSTTTQSNAGTHGS
ncbi:hypothetical protein [Cellulomonas sp. P24]|uniref:hypothetical protein n=1 Tax=Cellulomonas sp. P24 TaxID=2885206 RepID=UPI00216AEEB2|nr:hypothetical protein [Cellulomonas sp. P24]MCR6493991.1 hypothetical protein [Cellulomonas sp. P24]